MMDWKSWPIYNVLCFTVIPLRLRPMTSGVASMIWDAYVSHQVCLAFESVEQNWHGAHPGHKGVGRGRRRARKEEGVERGVGDESVARRLAGPSVRGHAHEQA